MSSHMGVATAVAVAVTMVGCSSRFEDRWSRARPPTHPAGGRVLASGKPIAGATVVFHPEAHTTGGAHAAVGMTDADGRFRLRTFRVGDGAVAGSYRVTIEKVDWSQPDPQDAEEWTPSVERSLLPAQYRDAALSGLAAEITTDGPNESVFDLQP